MPRSAATSIENNFSKGLITEATGLNFPENAATDTYNCIFEQTGNVKRRLGFDYEQNFDFAYLNRTNAAITEYLWESVGGNGALYFVVIQVGNTINFWQVRDTTSLSIGHKLTFGIDLNTYKTASSPSVNNIHAQFTSGNGFLFVTHPYCDPIYVEYFPDVDNIIVTPVLIAVRDFEGLDDGFDGGLISARPAIDIPAHKYNTYNQGWSTNAEVKGGPNGILYDVMKTKAGVYPSNSDIWYTFKNSDELWDSAYINRFGQPSSPAPKGHYIYNAFYIDRSAATGIAFFPAVTSSYYRPSTVAFYGGRVFYAGTNYKNYNQKIYFTKVLTAESKDFGFCYQENDPTDENNNDLLPTDGGVIVIPDIGIVHGMLTGDSNLYVFASNGIWVIGGSQGTGFSANDYSIKKLSSIPFVNPRSLVLADGIPFWWNLDGIYTLKPNEGGVPQVSSITDTTIKTFFNTIPQQSKQYCKGAYDVLSKTIQWVYRSELGVTSDQLYEYDKVLVFNLLTGAFYPWTISDNFTKIVGVVGLKGQGTVRTVTNVVDNAGNLVIDRFGNQIAVTTLINTPLNSVFKYTTVLFNGSTWGLTFSQTVDANYADWATSRAGTGIDYSSYFTTGYKVHGNAQKKFQTNYILTYMLSEEHASLYLKGVWDFAQTGTTGKVTSSQQVYNDNFDFKYKSSRVRIRGSGLSLQLKYYSEAGKPFNCIGWSAYETGDGHI